MSETVFNDAVNIKGQITVQDINIEGSSNITGTSTVFTSSDTTASTSSSAGSFLLAGGLSISKTTDATSSTNGGTITTAGGVAIAKKLMVGTQQVIGTDSQAITPLSTSQLYLVGDRTAGTNTSGIGFQRSGAVTNSIGIDTSDDFVISLGNAGDIVFQGGQSNFNASGTIRMSITSSQISTSFADDASSTVTGAFVVSGGVGIGKKLFIGTDLSVGGNVTAGTWQGSTITVPYGGTGATSLTANGVLVGNGASAISVGAGISYTSNTLTLPKIISNDTTDSTSSTTGSVTIAGGVGIAKKLFVGTTISSGGNIAVAGASSSNGNIQFPSSNNNRKIVLYETANDDHQYSGFGVNTGILRYQTSDSSSDHVFYSAIDSSSSLELARVLSSGGIRSSSITGSATASGVLTLRSTSNATKGQVYLDETTASSSTTTGALRVAGGVGIAGNIYTGGNLVATSNVSTTAGNITATKSTIPTITVSDGSNSSNWGIATTAADLSSDSGIADTILRSNNGNLLLQRGSGAYAISITATDILAKNIINSSNTTDSTSTSTGAIKTSGGVGVAKNLFVGETITSAGDYIFTNSSNIRRNTSDGSDTGVITISGGGSYGNSRGGSVLIFGNEHSTEPGNIVLEAGNGTDGNIDFYTGAAVYRGGMYKNGQFNIATNISTTTSSNGSLIVAGGAGVSGNIVGGANIFIDSDDSSVSVAGFLGIVKKTGDPDKLVARSGQAIFLSTSDLADVRTSDISAATIVDRFSILSTGETKVLSTTSSTSTTTGSLQTLGGAGIAGSVYIGGDLQVEGSLKTSVISKISPVYVRGAGVNNLVARLVKVGNTTHVNTTSVGLTLTIINSSTHALTSTTNYDTSTSGTASTDLATALDNMDRQQIGILASYSSFTGSINTTLRTAVKRLGLYKLSETTTTGTAYCAIFKGQGTGSGNTNVSNQVIEYISDAVATSDYALISTYLVDDSINIDTLPSALVSPDPAATIPAVYVKNSGNIGIGTTTADATLSIVATGSSSTPTQNGVFIDGSSTSPVIQLNGSTLSNIDFSVASSDYKGRILYTNSSNTFTWYTNTDEKMNLDTDGRLSLVKTTASTSNSTGVLQIAGGLGISNTTDATSSTNGGTITTAGGVAIAKKLYVGSDVSIGGGLTVTGSFSIPHSGLSGLAAGDDHTQYSLLAGRSGGQTITGGTASGNSLILRSSSNATKGQIYIDETTASTSLTTGALRVGGGVGIAGSVYSTGLNFGEQGSETTSPTSYSLINSPKNPLNGQSTTYYSPDLYIAGSSVNEGTGWNNAGAPTHNAGSLILSGGDYNDSSNNGSGFTNINGGNVFIRGGRAYVGDILSPNAISTAGSVIFQTGVSGAPNNNTSFIERAKITPSSTASSTTSATFVVSGGVGVSDNLFVGGSIVGATKMYLSGDNSVIAVTSDLGLVKQVGNNTKLVSNTGNSIILATSNLADVVSSDISAATITDRLTVSSAGVVNITATTVSTSTSTGALTVAGGVGVAGSIYSAGIISTSIAGSGSTLLGSYFQPSLGDGSNCSIQLGADPSTYNDMYINFTKVTVGNSANYTEIGLFGSSGALRIFGTGSATLTEGNLTVNKASDPKIVVGTFGGGDGKIYFGNSAHGIGRGASIGTLTSDNDISLWTTSGKVGLATNGTQRLIVEDGGDVQVLNRLKAATIHVETFSSIASQGVHIQWNRSNGQGETRLINQPGSGGDDAIYMSTSTTGNVVTDWAKFSGSGLAIYVGSNQTFDPNFRINTSSIDDPGSLTVNIGLDVTHNIKTTGVYGSSDARLKHNIQSVRDQMDYSGFIDEIDSKMFQWISDGPNGIQNYGYIAQDLIKRGFSGLVIATKDDAIHETVDEDGFVSPEGTRMSINYSNIIPILHENIRDLRQENRVMKHQIETLTQKILTLEARFAQ